MIRERRIKLAGIFIQNTHDLTISQDCSSPHLLFPLAWGNKDQKNLYSAGLNSGALGLTIHHSHGNAASFLLGIFIQSLISYYTLIFPQDALTNTSAVAPQSSQLTPLQLGQSQVVLKVRILERHIRAAEVRVR